MRRSATAVAAFAAAALLAGCGRADDERAAGAVTARFLAAVDAHEGRRACAQLTAAAAQALADDEGKPCADAARELELRPSAVRHIAVSVIGAKVDLADGESAFLALTPAGWRIAAAGCRPAGGDAPYTCEVEA